MQEHGIPCKFLEAFSSEEEAKGQKAEYSLIDHLKQGKVDLFINLPSRNRFRRPQQHISRGYRARRTAIDHAIPLITNVKNAKILIEGLARYPTLSISSTDAKSSHQTIRFPGLIDSATFVDKLDDCEAGSLEQVSLAAVRAGYLTLQVLALGATARIDDAKILETAQASISGRAHCNYSFSVAATSQNAANLESPLCDQASALMLPFRRLGSDANQAVAIAAHFTSWPAGKPIMTDAKTTDLASVLLLASLHGRSVHVINVGSAADIELIALSKKRGLKVTADVAIYTLFLNQALYPRTTCLPTVHDQEVIWENLEHIDTFSVGSVPYELAIELEKPYLPGDGYEESVQLLLSAINDGRLTIEDVTLRCSENPANIFNLPVPKGTYVEVQIDRANVFSKSTWSPLQGQACNGTVHRVVFRDETLYLDGLSHSKAGSGEYLTDCFAPASRPMLESNSRTTTQFVPKSHRPSLAYAGAIESPDASAARSTSGVGVASPNLPATGLGLQPSMMSLSLGQNYQSPSAQGVRANDPQILFPSAVATLSPPIITFERDPAFYNRHILTVKQFTRHDLHGLFNVAQELRTQVERNGVLDILKGKVMCSMFYEPSTRTSASFEAAMNRLGGRVVSISADKSSAAKGESLEDTIKTLGCYGDAIVLRHPAAGSAQNAAKASPVPIINAGDGIGEHPTQVSCHLD